MKDALLKVLLPNGAVLGVVTLTNMELALKLSLLAASLLYTLLRIVAEIQKMRRPKP